MHVPGWHAATSDLQAAGKLQMVGIIQEQHPDRARLFMQWKEMDWPLLVDSLGLLRVTVVPITVAIDEHGVVRRVGIPMQEAGEFAAEFVKQRYEPPEEKPPTMAERPEPERLRPGPQENSAGHWRAYADALTIWNTADRLTDAIGAYERARALEPDDGITHFHLGVAHRMRYDSGDRRPGDFQKAVSGWSRALEIDPNNYIWRRRIQQYGPRLDKPYPFYDWVPIARREIAARGHEPRPLVAEPGGAEFATRETSFSPDARTIAEPDPNGRIHRDHGELIDAETVVVPPTSDPGAAARVHMMFRPNRAAKAHWNNEVADLVVWIDPPDGWQVDRRKVTVPNPPAAVSEETRRVEFEVKRIDRSGKRGDQDPVRAYALYYVCEGIDGACLYRRQDVELTLP